MKCQVTDLLPQKEILAQLAEESAELAQAALKLRRVLDGRNPARTGYYWAVQALNEEIADVTMCFDLIHCVDYNKINTTREQKMKRWIRHLLSERRKRDARKSAKRKRE